MILSKEKFLNKYTDTYIKCYTEEEVMYFVDNYASNRDNWKNNVKKRIEEHKYNEIGIIITIDKDERVWWGYYDEDVKVYINALDIINNIKIKIVNTETNMNEITEILEKVYEDHELRKTIVPLFISNPGLGKSSLVNKFAKDKGVKMVELITSQMSPFEISGISIPDKESKRMTYYNFDNLMSLKDGDILFFDELLNGNPNVLNACLTILEQRKMISGDPLPNILICAAANPQGMVPLTPQIKERFVWYKLTFNKPSWIKFMVDKYDITQSIGNKLANLIINEDFTGDNFMTPRSLDKAVNMILKDTPTPYNKNILPILEELIENTSSNTIKIGDEEFLPGETKKWINIIKLKRQHV